MEENYFTHNEEELMMMDDSELFKHIIGDDEDLNHVNNLVANYFSSYN